jgi:hypothetical protein
MSQSTGESSAPLGTEIHEVQGIFPTDAALQDAMSRLTLLGFDRADLSLPAATPEPGENTPDQGAADPNSDADSRQLRTMGTGMAATVGAMAAAGATVATGGLALPVIGAAVLGGLGAGAATHAVQRGSDQLQDDARREAAETGRLVLAVHLRKPSEQASAEQAMEQAGATKIVAVARRAPGAADSAGWTG